eukprot:TRINITY_DN15237_c0_g4_i2.p1 TRINITY_DN15237_c0_g4~~TRINITY_DN15237_c0_g4_i2.p1  ORF type:complete len:703 (+),score=147.05 TRINITY_DN15237_c0_g4_i2:179-2287(+)
MCIGKRLQTIAMTEFDDDPEVAFLLARLRAAEQMDNELRRELAAAKSALIETPLQTEAAPSQSKAPAACWHPPVMGGEQHAVGVSESMPMALPRLGKEPLVSASARVSSPIQLAERRSASSSPAELNWAALPAETNTPAHERRKRNLSPLRPKPVTGSVHVHAVETVLNKPEPAADAPHLGVQAVGKSDCELLSEGQRHDRYASWQSQQDTTANKEDEESCLHASVPPAETSAGDEVHREPPQLLSPQGSPEVLGAWLFAAADDGTPPISPVAHKGQGSAPAATHQCASPDSSSGVEPCLREEATPTVEDPAPVQSTQDLDMPTEALPAEKPSSKAARAKKRPSPAARALAASRVAAAAIAGSQGAASDGSQKESNTNYQASWLRWRSMPSALEERWKELLDTSAEEICRTHQAPSKEAVDFLESLLADTEPEPEPLMTRQGSTKAHQRAPAPPKGSGPALSKAGGAVPRPRQPSPAATPSVQEGSSQTAPPDTEHTRRMEERRQEHERRLQELEEKAELERQRIKAQMEKDLAEVSASRDAQTAWKEDFRRRAEEKRIDAERQSRLRAEHREKMNAAWQENWWKTWKETAPRPPGPRPSAQQVPPASPRGPPPRPPQPPRQPVPPPPSAATVSSNNVPVQLQKEQRNVLALLRAERTGSLEERKQVWRRLCLRWHPDKCDDKDQATAMFQYLQGVKQWFLG